MEGAVVVERSGSSILEDEVEATALPDEALLLAAAAATAAAAEEEPAWMQVSRASMSSRTS